MAERNLKGIRRDALEGKVYIWMDINVVIRRRPMVLEHETNPGSNRALVNMKYSSDSLSMGCNILDWTLQR